MLGFGKKKMNKKVVVKTVAATAGAGAVGIAVGRLSTQEGRDQISELTKMAISGLTGMLRHGSETVDEIIEE
jgi:hypothetical protein